MSLHLSPPIILNPHLLPPLLTPSSPTFIQVLPFLILKIPCHLPTTNNIFPTKTSPYPGLIHKAFTLSSISIIIINVYLSTLSNLSLLFAYCIFFLFHVFRVSILERGLNKVENKYTLKMKCFGNNGMGDEQTLQNIIDMQKITSPFSLNRHNRDAKSNRVAKPRQSME